MEVLELFLTLLKWEVVSKSAVIKIVLLKICKSPTEFHFTIFYVMKCERLMCFILGLNEITNILLRRWLIGSFLYSIENSDFCTKFGPFLDPFSAKSPNCGSSASSSGFKHHQVSSSVIKHHWVSLSIIERHRALSIIKRQSIICLINTGLK